MRQIRTPQRPRYAANEYGRNPRLRRLNGAWMAGMGEPAEILVIDANDRSSARFTIESCADGKSYRARLTTPVLSASTDVAINRQEFTAFFEDLAAHWRGWEGTRSFKAHRVRADYEQHVLELQATSDRLGHVAFLILISSGWHEPHWSAQQVIPTEAGQLETLAQAAAALPYESPGLW